jgi:hypothetical protein
MVLDLVVCGLGGFSKLMNVKLVHVGNREKIGLGHS